MSDQSGASWRDPVDPNPADPYGWGPTPYPGTSYPAPPPYSAPSQYAAAPGPGDQPPPPTGRRRRIHPAFIIVGGIVVAAIVVGVLVAVLAKGSVVDSPGTSGRRLAVPASIPGYRAVSGVDTENLKENLAEQLADKSGDDPADIAQGVAVGVFDQTSTGGRVVFVGIGVQRVSSLRGELRSDGVENTLKFFMAGAASSYGAGRSSTPFPAGPLKGFLRCSMGKIDGRAASVCGWADESAVALTIFTKVPSLSDAAAATRTLRSAIERS